MNEFVSVHSLPGHGRQAMPRLVHAVFVIVMLSGLIAGHALSQEAAEWIPKGGAGLLVRVLEACDDCDGLAALGSADRSREEWRSYFEEHGVLEVLTEEQRATLVAYLAINLPRDELSRESLPRAGNALVFETCSACHSPAPALTQDHDEDGWLTFIRVNHEDFTAGFDYTDEQVQTMAAYLSSNMPMPTEEIPEALRRGFEGY